MGYRVVVVGATGNVGREMLNILSERQFPLDEVAAVASPRSTGDIIDFGDSGQELRVSNLQHFDFTGWDIALFAAGSAASKEFAPKAAAAGCIVIDNSSHFRMDPDVPLIVCKTRAASAKIAGFPSAAPEASSRLTPSRLVRHSARNSSTSSGPGSSAGSRTGVGCACVSTLIYVPSLPASALST